MDATSAIDVLVFSAEFGCCGIPFAAGEDVTLTVRAPVDDLPAPDGVPTYLHELHPYDDRVPLADVTGRVERIVAWYERMVPVAGAHYRTNDPDDRIERDVDRVPTDDHPAGYGGPDYRVRIRIPSDTRLPDPAPELPPAPDIDAPPPPRILPLLTTLVADVASEFGDAVDVLRGREDASVTLQPRREGAAAVRWNAYLDQLTAEIEHAEWTLTDDEAGVAVLRDLVAAAAAGRFSETEEDWTIVSVATTADGRAYEATTTVSRFPLGGDVVMLGGSDHERIERARSGSPFLPWSDEV
ncbi:DUF6578 domain-containing protein [Leifsonia sp. 1010]|uniref:DUF6578 domain-containing protein n=1 Tax=Leifsonia sp. 1010 TaxID=2817769 RepID=UPI00285993B7|nr:DUF6578 domain-containing protein [Leifsonia sp. 1010]MDR6613924.1 hypothetical protein [Leifsonia sp. 1010]